MLVGRAILVNLIRSLMLFKVKFPEIDKIPLIGNTSAESVSAEKLLTLNPDIAINGNLV